MHRRDLLKYALALPAASFFSTFDALAQSTRGLVKITAIKAMNLKGAQTLIRIDTDAGISGFGECGGDGPMARSVINLYNGGGRLPHLGLIGKDPLAIQVQRVCQSRRIPILRRLFRRTEDMEAHLDGPASPDAGQGSALGPATAAMNAKGAEDQPVQLAHHVAAAQPQLPDATGRGGAAAEEWEQLLPSQAVGLGRSHLGTGERLDPLRPGARTAAPSTPWSASAASSTFTHSPRMAPARPCP